MQIYHNECRLHAEVLAEALKEAYLWLPLNAVTLEHLTKEQLRVLDQLAYRFTKLQDTMSQKVLPTILETDCIRRNFCREAKLVRTNRGITFSG